MPAQWSAKRRTRQTREYYIYPFDTVDKVDFEVGTALFNFEVPVAGNTILTPLAIQSRLETKEERIRARAVSFGRLAVAESAALQSTFEDTNGQLRKRLDEDLNTLLAAPPFSESTQDKAILKSRLIADIRAVQTKLMPPLDSGYSKYPYHAFLAAEAAAKEVLDTAFDAPKMVGEKTLSTSLQELDPDIQGQLARPLKRIPAEVALGCAVSDTDDKITLRGRINLDFHNVFREIAPIQKTRGIVINDLAQSMKDAAQQAFKATTKDRPRASHSPA